MKTLFRVVSIIILAHIALFGISGATQIVYQSLDQLGANASAVVVGKVAAVRSYWNEDHTKIFTETTVTVEESFKGQPGPSVRVVQLGGTVDNVQVTAHGALQWKPEEEIVLFLEPADSGAYQVSGFSQGKFQVERDPGTGAAFVMRPALAGAEYVGTPDDKATVKEVDRTPLEDFMAEALGDAAPARKN